MKLTVKNIVFVKELVEGEITYSWFVSMKGDQRNYVNYENGKTIASEYRKEELPKAVQNFINNHNRELFSVIDEEHNVYIYR